MNIKITPFTNDGEKMRDFFDLTKEEFLESYSYLTEEEYDATAEYSQSLSGFATTVSAQLKHTKETKSTANGALILTMNVNQNAIGVEKPASALSAKLLKKTNKKEKTNYETQ